MTNISEEYSEFKLAPPPKTIGLIYIIELSPN